MDPDSRHNIGRTAHGGKAVPRCNILAGRTLSATGYSLDYDCRGVNTDSNN